MNLLLSFLLLAAAYLVGGLSPGYWLVRWRTGSDLRAHGSGATGATNAGRVLGRAGFAVVLLLDAAKAALVVALARGSGAGPAWEYAAGGAAIAGHIWPVQLGFRGGKGVAPLLGAWLVLEPLALLPCLALALAGWGVTRSLTVGGLAGLGLLAPATWFLTHRADATLLAALACALVAGAHRANLRAWRLARPAPAGKEPRG